MFLNFLIADEQQRHRILYRAYTVYTSGFTGLLPRTDLQFSGNN